MSFVSVWKNRCCFVWTVERPLRDRPRYSPKFTVNSRGLYLEYSFYSLNNEYRIFMRNMMECTSLSVTVYVESRNRHALPLSLHYVCHSEYPTIWRFTEAKILNAVPDFMTDGLSTFVVTIDNGANCYDFKLEPPIDIPVRKEDKSVQKDLPSVQKEEKSVQTPSHLNTAPCLERLSEDFSKLVEQNSQSDAVLLCGDRTIAVHKNVLSARSRVFAAMLSTDMTEGRAGLVEVQNVDPAIFDHFVRYLYTGRLPDLTVETAKRYYEIADKYAVSSLMKRYASFLEEHLEPDNACDMLALADAHSDEKFKETVINYILKENILVQDEFWLPFCKSQPMLAIEVLNFFSKLQMLEKPAK